MVCGYFCRYAQYLQIILSTLSTLEENPPYLPTLMELITEWLFSQILYKENSKKNTKPFIKRKHNDFHGLVTETIYHIYLRIRKSTRLSMLMYFGITILSFLRPMIS